jgi:hypothetical protein
MDEKHFALLFLAIESGGFVYQREDAEVAKDAVLILGSDLPGIHEEPEDCSLASAAGRFTSVLQSFDVVGAREVPGGCPGSRSIGHICAPVLRRSRGPRSYRGGVEGLGRWASDRRISTSEMQRSASDVNNAPSRMNISASRLNISASKINISATEIIILASKARKRGFGDQYLDLGDFEVRSLGTY